MSVIGIPQKLHLPVGEVKSRVQEARLDFLCTLKRFIEICTTSYAQSDLRQGLKLEIPPFLTSSSVM